MTLADGSEDGPHGAAEYKHLHEECLVLFSAERLYTAAFFCQRPHPCPACFTGDVLLTLAG